MKRTRKCVDFFGFEFECESLASTPTNRDNKRVRSSSSATETSVDSELLEISEKFDRVTTIDPTQSVNCDTNFIQLKKFEHPVSTSGK